MTPIARNQPRFAERRSRLCRNAPKMCAAQHAQHAHHRGVALITVLWIGVLASLLLLGVQQATRIDTSLAHGDLASVQARWLARAGVEQAIATLADDDAGSDSSLDWWYEDAAAFEQIELATGTFSVIAPPDDNAVGNAPRYGIEDMSGRLPINHVDEAQLERLQIRGQALDAGQVAAILDWRDDDNETRNGGAERGYYQGMRFGYEIRNGAFRTIHELKLVRNIDDRTFYGEDANLNGRLDANEDDGSDNPPADNADGALDRGLAGLVSIHAYQMNQDSAGYARVNVNDANPQQIAQQLGISLALARGIVEARDDDEFDTLMDLEGVEPEQRRRGGPGRGNDDDDDDDDDDDEDEQDDPQTEEITLQWIADYMDQLTLSDEDRLHGRININTAPREVLMTLPEVDREAANAMINYRESSNGPYSSPGGLYATPGVSDELFREIAERVTVRSNVFRIVAIGETPTGVRQRMTVIVDRGTDPIRVLYWHEGN